MALLVLVNWGKRLFKGANRSASTRDEEINNDPTQLLLPTSTSKRRSERAVQAREVGDGEKDKFRITARIISDATIGLSDGLTVPFALSAGLSALGNANIVIYAGLAELIAGAISMGAGGWLGAKKEA